MKRFLPILLLTGFSSPVMADITHKLSSSVQLQVNAAATQVERIGSSYSVSGNGVDTTDGTTVNTVSAGTSHQVLWLLAQLLQHRMFLAPVSAIAKPTFKATQYHKLHHQSVL